MTLPNAATASSNRGGGGGGGRSSRFSRFRQRHRLPPLTPHTLHLYFTTSIFAFGDMFVYLLGPVLILAAMGILAGLSYTFFVVMVPMLAGPGRDDDDWLILHSMMSVSVFFHVVFVIFIISNIVLNYGACVMTSNVGKEYETVVRELAEVTDYDYPETEEDVIYAKRDFEQKIYDRRRRLETDVRQGLNTDINLNMPIYAWMLMGPREWGFCKTTSQPKPPRAHYDHVSKTLVLNMDHYCPWMFNVVGYFNYRYFTNFLFYTFVGMIYGVILTFRPFRNLDNGAMMNQIKLSRESGYQSAKHLVPLVPIPSERLPIVFSFMICASVGIAVACLLTLHVYLILSAQTTIEFYGNWGKKRKARLRGTTWINPYDMGYRRNWQQVYGVSHPFIAMLPSLRQPEFLPLPLEGDRGKRRRRYEKKYERDVASVMTNDHNDNVLVRRNGEEVVPFIT